MNNAISRGRFRRFGRASIEVLTARLGLALIGLASCSIIWAQPGRDATAVAQPLAGGRFYESYDDRVPSSTTTLVGLRIGNGAKQVNPGEIFIPLAADQPAHFCVKAVTQDGRYSSENPYRVVVEEPGPALALLDPLTIDYEDVLSDYQLDEFAIQAFYRQGSEDPLRWCDPVQPIYLPFIAERNQQPILHAFVNTGLGNRTVKLILMADGEERENVGVCRPSGASAKIAYDVHCTVIFSVDAEPSYATLMIELNTMFAVEELTFRVYLPPVP